MTHSRKKPGVAFWATVVAVAALAYVAGCGPACWLRVTDSPLPSQVYATLHWLYRPMDWLVIYGPMPISAPVYRYAEFWMEL
jgi:hypothetical protein